jgi:hypothetical protein
MILVFNFQLIHRQLWETGYWRAQYETSSWNPTFNHLR